MEKFVIQGGVPLKGEVALAGAKNSGFKLMIASLLSGEKSRIEGFSKIGDVYSTAKIIEELGGKVSFQKNHILEVEGRGLKKFEFSEKTGRLSRASTYFVGPLLYYFGKAIIPIPGGCKIGQRPLDRHLTGFKALGAKIKDCGDYYRITANKFKGATFHFPKITHGGTDAMLISSVLAEGETILENVALEPEVDDLIGFLNSMGAKIKRLGGRKIIIKGVKKLKGTSYRVMPDRNEAVTFACSALITQGDILVKKANPKVLTAFLDKVKKINGGFEIKKEGIRFFWKGQLHPSRVVTKPYPSFMTDWQPLWTTLMTQAKGKSIIIEAVHSWRFAFVRDLIAMGAKIQLFSPKVPNPERFYNFNLEDDRPEYFHAARIFGPTPLRGAQFTISDIRAGATLIMAALVAKGKTQLRGIEHIDRGYENLDGRLRELGAKIKRG